MTARKTFDLFQSLANGSLNKVTITALNQKEAIRYSISLSREIKPGTRLIMTSNSYRHLLNSAHITGRGKKQHIRDPNPLTEVDIENLAKVFKNPDELRSEGRRVVVEKSIGHSYRLVMELIKHGEEFRLVTYFNINKKPLK